MVILHMVDVYTSTGLYDMVNGIVDAIKAPGEWFKIHPSGFVPGIAFLGIVGTALALIAIYAL